MRTPSSESIPGQVTAAATSDIESLQEGEMTGLKEKQVTKSMAEKKPARRQRERVVLNRSTNRSSRPLLTTVMSFLF